MTLVWDVVRMLVVPMFLGGIAALVWSLWEMRQLAERRAKKWEAVACKWEALSNDAFEARDRAIRGWERAQDCNERLVAAYSYLRSRVHIELPDLVIQAPEDISPEDDPELN